MKLNELVEDVMNLDINKESMDDNCGHSQDQSIICSNSFNIERILSNSFNIDTQHSFNIFVKLCYFIFVKICYFDFFFFLRNKTSTFINQLRPLNQPKQTGEYLVALLPSRQLDFDSKLPSQLSYGLPRFPDDTHGKN